MKISAVNKAINKYGSEMTLGKLLDIVKNDYKYVCPKCGGYGYKEEKYYVMSHSSDDDGARYRQVHCEVCDGIGYTEKEMVPVTENHTVGYEERVD